MLKQYKQLLQTTEIKQGVAIIGATKFTPAQIKPQSFESRRNSFFLPGVDASHVYVRAWALGCYHSPISTQPFRRALTASVDSCAERVPLQWRNQIWQKPNLAEFGGWCRKVMLGVWVLI